MQPKHLAQGDSQGISRLSRAAGERGPAKWVLGVRDMAARGLTSAEAHLMDGRRWSPNVRSMRLINREAGGQTTMMMRVGWSVAATTDEASDAMGLYHSTQWVT